VVPRADVTAKLSADAHCWLSAPDPSAAPWHVCDASWCRHKPLTCRDPMLRAALMYIPFFVTLQNRKTHTERNATTCESAGWLATRLHTDVLPSSSLHCRARGQGISETMSRDWIGTTCRSRCGRVRLQSIVILMMSSSILNNPTLPTDSSHACRLFEHVQL
jgi:hypothetical protein